MDLSSSFPYRHVLYAVLVTLATLGLLLATLDDPGIAWDEGITIRRSQRIGDWFAEIVHPRQLARRADAFRPELIVDRTQPNDLFASYWPFVWVLEGHPPGYAMLVNMGWQVSHRWLGPLAAYRFGPALLFSLTSGIVFLCMARWYDVRAAATAASAMVFFPRLFAHAHFASYDVPVLCFWVLSTLAFVRASGASGRDRSKAHTNPSDRESEREKGPIPKVPSLEPTSGDSKTSRGWTVLFGLLLGFAFLTKFTGWMAFVPLACWCGLYRHRRGLVVLGIGSLVAVLVFYLLNPAIWQAPVEGVLTFFARNLNRADQAHLNIAGRFFGHNYDLAHPLPWYNSLVWVGITLPVGTLILVSAGIVRVVLGRFRDRVATLMLLSAVLLLAVRALPGAPPHDGVRLFLPSFAFLACLAGVGAAKSHGVGVFRGLPRWATSGGIALLLVGSAWSTWYYHPHQLSHYNLLIGGLPGAVRAGMEPTYYWDGMTDDVLDWMNANTAPDAKVMFSSYDLSSKESWRLLREWRKLEPRVDPRDSGKTQWYVLQHRASSYRPYDAWLVEHATPVHVKRVHERNLMGWGPFRLDVPLISVYDFNDLERAAAATQ